MPESEPETIIRWPTVRPCVACVKVAVAPDVAIFAVPKSPIPTGLNGDMLVYAVRVSLAEKLLLVVICTLSTVFPVATKAVFESIGPSTRPVAVFPTFLTIVFEEN